MKALLWYTNTKAKNIISAVMDVRGSLLKNQTSGKKLNRIGATHATKM